MQETTDVGGGYHLLVKYTIAGTYTGDRTGTVYTEAPQGRAIVNAPSSGAFNSVTVLNGLITANDGSVILQKDRMILVVDAHGVTHVERNNLATTALRCQGQ